MEEKDCEHGGERQGTEHECSLLCMGKLKMTETDI